MVGAFTICGLRGSVGVWMDAERPTSDEAPPFQPPHMPLACKAAVFRDALSEGLLSALRTQVTQVRPPYRRAPTLRRGANEG